MFVCECLIRLALHHHDVMGISHIHVCMYQEGNPGVPVMCVCVKCLSGSHAEQRKGHSEFDLAW